MSLCIPNFNVPKTVEHNYASKLAFMNTSETCPMHKSYFIIADIISVEESNLEQFDFFLAR